MPKKPTKKLKAKTTKTAPQKRKPMRRQRKAPSGIPPVPRDVDDSRPFDPGSVL